MPSVMIQLGVLLCLTGWLGVVSLAQCPSYCTCSGKTAICKNVNGMLNQPFPDDIVNITIEQSNNITIGPNLFGKNVEHILVQTSMIDLISSHAFSNMQSVVSIRFVKVIIQKIDSCAFFNIHSSAVIEFREASIKIIESSAFSHLSGLKEIIIPLTTVDEVKSHGFFNIQTQTFSVEDSDIHVLNTAAISEFQDIDVFNFSRVKFTTVNAGAFSNLRSIAKVQLDMCSFVNIQCNAIMELREATPGDHQSFTFTNSSLVCNCSTLSMLGYALSNPNAISDSVQCLPVRQGEAYKPLRSLTSQMMCPGDGNPLDPTCDFSDPEPVTCKGDLMVTTPSATTKKGETTTKRPITTTPTRQTTTMNSKAAFAGPPTCGMLITFTFLTSSFILQRHQLWTLYFTL